MKFTYAESYNDIKEKIIVNHINNLKKPINRMEIQEIASKMLIPSRTLSDILKRNVIDKNIKRLGHGIYSSKKYKL